MMKKNKNFKIINIVLGIIFVLLLVLIAICIYFLSPVGGDGEDVGFVVLEGSSLSEIGNNLEEMNLIKNGKFFLGYSIITNNRNIYAAKYTLNNNMSLSEIVEILSNGGVNSNDVSLTFNEGINARGVARVISDNTNISYDDVLEKMNDDSYIDSLIDEYWFLTDDIKNSGIYYSLEGYLFPDTYYIDKENSTIQDIFKLMLDAMGSHLEEYREEIENSDYSIHELITLASVTQSEGYNESDFKNIASVFYNRMATGMPLGSCVTSYYGVRKEMTEELSNSDINSSNLYNTRGDNPVNFPVGPISMPGLDALEAVFNPNDTDYYYFVSDKNHKLYFTKSLEEHEQMISDLQSEGLWLEW